ncbi:DUF6382 domain-containing protein [Gorillibacterium massiliense]|uniref:DUF6382 domain-containing protein n=1 Tax=Gorillibacterium massiliense TaxID=1280390 RepID=UPI0004B52734|nr:DUF6382 domain-containing protein [Gorillibacterium massiliense]
MFELEHFHCESVEIQSQRLLRLTGKTPIAPSDLLQPDWNMLRHYQVPHLLAIEVEEWNGEVTLLYKRTGLRTLSMELSHRSLTEKRFVRFLIALLSVLGEADRYLLSPECFILELEYIYFGTGLEDLYLMYIPLVQMKEVPALPLRLKRLVNRVSTLLPIPLSLQNLLENISEEDFDLVLLKRQLKAYTESSPTPRLPETETNLPILPEHIISAQPTVKVKNAEKFHSSTGELPAKKRSFPTNSQLAFGSAALLLTIGWYRYLTVPSDGLLYFDLGLTMLAADGLYVWRKWAGSKERNPGAKTSGLVAQSKAKPKTQLKKPVLHEEEPKNESISPVSPEQYYASLSAQTQLLRRDSQETVLLRKEDAADSVEEPRYVLEWEKDGTAQRIPVIIPSQESGFMIGREPELSQPFLTKMEISRQHAEIRKSNDGYILRDLGSKNGTRHNGQELLPFKDYALVDGDEIDAAGVRFIFRREDGGVSISKG